MLEQNSFQNQCQLRNAIYRKNIVFPKENNDFECLVGLELAIKTNEKSIKNELKMGRHRGINF